MAMPDKKMLRPVLAAFVKMETTPAEADVAGLLAASLVLVLALADAEWEREERAERLARLEERTTADLDPWPPA